MHGQNTACKNQFNCIYGRNGCVKQGTCAVNWCITNIRANGCCHCKKWKCESWNLRGHGCTTPKPTVTQTTTTTVTTTTVTTTQAGAATTTKATTTAAFVFEKVGPGVCADTQGNIIKHFLKSEVGKSTLNDRACQEHCAGLASCIGYSFWKKKADEIQECSVFGNKLDLVIGWNAEESKKPSNDTIGSAIFDDTQKSRLCWKKSYPTTTTATSTTTTTTETTTTVTATTTTTAVTAATTATQATEATMTTAPDTTTKATSISETTAATTTSTADPLERFAPPVKGHVNQKFELPLGTVRLGPRQCAIMCRDEPTCHAYAVKNSTGECVLSTATSSSARGNKVKVWEFYDKCSVSPTNCSGGTAAQVLKNSGSGDTGVTNRTAVVVDGAADGVGKGTSRGNGSDSDGGTTPSGDASSSGGGGGQAVTIVVVVTLLVMACSAAAVVMYKKREAAAAGGGMGTGTGMFGGAATNTHESSQMFVSSAFAPPTFQNAVWEFGDGDTGAAQSSSRHGKMPHYASFKGRGAGDEGAYTFPAGVKAQGSDVMHEYQESDAGTADHVVTATNKASVVSNEYEYGSAVQARASDGMYEYQASEHLNLTLRGNTALSGESLYETQPIATLRRDSQGLQGTAPPAHAYEYQGAAEARASDGMYEYGLPEAVARGSSGASGAEYDALPPAQSRYAEPTEESMQPDYLEPTVRGGDATYGKMMDI